MSLDDYPLFQNTIQSLLAIWPEHQSFLEKGVLLLENEVTETLERAAVHSRKIIGDDLTIYLNDYKWMCERFKEEQLYFQRHKQYRLTSFQDAYDEVYNNPEYMQRYTRGILMMSKFFWPNHSRCLHTYLTEYLPGNTDNYRHLDIGAGHGAYLVFAADDVRCASCDIWDISDTSLSMTMQYMQKMGSDRKIEARKQDLLQDSSITGHYDSIVCSEVLEHVEQPQTGLEHINRLLTQGGRAFINIPINSPAPDHITLWRSSDELKQLYEDTGFKILALHEYPAAGLTLERAKKFDFDISCVAILQKP